MSSWLGTGISQLTGQISTFTKEVLTEGTEEVDDHATQFKLARNRVTELEALCTAQKAEIERVAINYADLEEKLESSELQVNAISNEYRTIIQQKEGEIQQLQHHQHALNEGQGQISPGVLENSDFDGPYKIQNIGNEAQNQEGRSSLKEDGQHQDSEQYEAHIQTLQAQLCSEKDTHQVELAALQDVQSQKISLLKKRHKEEIRKYKEELEEIHELKEQDGDANHTKELEDQVRHMQEITHKQSVDLEHMHAADKQKTQELVKLNQELNQANDKAKKFEKEQDRLSKECHGYMDDIEAITKDNQNLKLHLGELAQKSQSQQPFRAVSTPKGKGASNWRNDDLGDGTDDSIVSDFNHVSEHSDRLDSKVHTLQQQVDTYEQEIEHFEMVKSDWLMEKEALEEVLLKLREQMREKEEALILVQAEQGLLALQQQEICDNKQEYLKRSQDQSFDTSHDQSDDKSEERPDATPSEEEEQDIEQHVLYLNEQVNLLTRGSAQLENEHDIMVKEKNNLLKELQEQKNKVFLLEKQLETVTTEKKLLQDSSGDLKIQIEELNSSLLSVESKLIVKEQEFARLTEEMKSKETLKAETDIPPDTLKHDDVIKEQLQQTKTKLAEVWNERDSLMESLEELDTQHQQAIEQLIKSKDQVQQNTDQLQVENDRLHDTVALVKSDLSAQIDEKNSKIEEMKIKITEVTTSLNDSKMNNKELQDLVNGLKKDLQTMNNDLKEAVNEKNELIVMCSEFKAEIRSKTEEISILQHSNVKTDSGEIQTQEEIKPNTNLEHQERKRQEEIIFQITTEKKDLEKEVNKLHEQLQSLQGKFDIIYKDKEQLLSEVQLHTERTSVVATEKEDLLTEVDNMKKVNEELETKLLEEQKKLEDSIEECQKLEKQLELSNSEWEDRLDADHSAMIAVRESVERELKSTETELKEKVKQYDTYILELTQSRDLDKSGLQGEYERVMKVNHEKDVQISKLEADIQTVQSDMEYNKDMLQNTIDGQSHITSLLAEKDSEIDLLKSENSTLMEKSEQQEDVLKRNEAELDRLNHIETLYKQNTEETKKLKVDIDGLKKQLRDLKTEEESRQIESNTLGIMTDLEAEITSLKEKLETKDENIELKGTEIFKLQKALEDKQMLLETNQKENIMILEKLKVNEMDISNLKEINNKINLELQKNVSDVSQKTEMIKNQGNLIENLKQTLQAKETALRESSSKLEVLNNELLSIKNVTLSNDYDSVKNKMEGHKESVLLTSGHNDHVIHYNGINGNAQQVDSIQVENLRTQIEEKDGIISILKDKINTVTSLLEERSMSLHGDATVVDIHKLEAELRSLRMEKEQMMQVLNDKTRECSQLKGEVHKLMNVVSAEKAALSKLQQDNQQMKDQEPDKPNKDMSKEAVKQLSRIIRDKDLEIESLNQKNITLLQVLQESSPTDGGTQISNLIQERDNLQKQLTMFQNDREQLVAALSAKHHESVSYHAEIQRLNALISDENQKQDLVQQEYASLMNQYQDRQKTLVTTQQEYSSLMAQYQDTKKRLSSTQDELSLLKQRYTEIDNRYKEMLQKKLAQSLENSQQREKNNLQQQMNSQSVQTTKTPPLTQGEEEELGNTETTTLESESVKETDSGFTTPPPLHAEPTQCNHIEELQNLQAIIRMHEDAFEEKDKAIVEKDKELISKNTIIVEKGNLLHDKEKQIVEKHNLLHEKDKQYSELSTRFHKTEQMLRTRDSEINSVKKQNENLAFQLRGMEPEVVDLRSEKEMLSNRLGTLEQQLEMNKEANNKLSGALKDHAFELNALKEKNNTLTRLLQEKGNDGNEKGEMDRLMKETETLQHQARAFKVDADQFAMALQQQQEENRELKTELQKVNEREQKLSREVERLRNHLMQVEEGYTRELLEAEEREKDLRNRLAAAEDRALFASSSVDRANLHASQQVETLHEQLVRLTEERDNAVLQYSTVQELASQYAQQLANLQMVLEQFQQEKEQQQAAEIEHYLRELSTLKQKNNQLITSMHETQLELDECKEALQAAQRLSEQLDKKEEMISALRIEVQDREHQLSDAEEKITVLSIATDAKIDKALAKNLILGYFHTPASHRQEVIFVLARALEFTRDEIQQLQGDAGGSSWLGAIFRKKSSPTPPTTPRRAVNNVSFLTSLDKSFSELFVTFLEKESTPSPELKFPAERMAREQQEKFQEQHDYRKQAFNPFSAPVPSIDPFSAHNLPSLPPPASSGSLFIETGTQGNGNRTGAKLPISSFQSSTSTPLLTTAASSSSSSSLYKSDSSSHLLIAPAASSNLPIFSTVETPQPPTSAVLQTVLQQ